jgi:hypothetical protein
MRTLAHLSAMLLALPQILLATAFLLLGHVTGTKTLGGLLTRVLDVFLALFTWGGLLALFVFAVLAVSVVFDRTRLVRRNRRRAVRNRKRDCPPGDRAIRVGRLVAVCPRRGIAGAVPLRGKVARLVGRTGPPRAGLERMTPDGKGLAMGSLFRGNEFFPSR